MKMTKMKLHRMVHQKETRMYMFVLLVVVHALTVERTIIHKINVDLMLDLNVINATVLVTKLNFVGWTQINTVKSIIGNIMITLRIGTRKTAKKSKPIWLLSIHLIYF